MEHAHELPEFLHFLEELIEEYGILRGFVFGFVHTLIPLIGFYSGWSINRFLKLVSNGAIAGIIGIVLAHIIADFIAALLDPDLKSAAYWYCAWRFFTSFIRTFFRKICNKKSVSHCCRWSWRSKKRFENQA